MTTMTKPEIKKRKKESSIFNVRSMTIIGMLSAVSFILMLFELPLWFTPVFYKIDISELPVLIGSFALGPIAGVMIELIKNLANLAIQGTETAAIGEASNFVIGCALVVPSAIIYNWRKTKKSAILGLCIGTITLVVIGSLLNAFILLPTYASVYGMPLDSLVQMGTAVNPKITSLSTFVLFAVAPFNLIKGVLVSVLTILLYKRISPIIKGHNSTR